MSLGGTACCASNPTTDKNSSVVDRLSWDSISDTELRGFAGQKSAFVALVGRGYDTPTELPNKLYSRERFCAVQFGFVFPAVA
ncbi:unnamed protein product [Ixodes pacificus]